jgi:6-phosphogluconolactonase
MALEQDTVGGGDVRWHRGADSASLHRAACERIAAAAHQAIAHRNRFDLVLAGGNTPRAIYRMLRYIDTDWSRWHLYFGDERCLPPDDADRNSVMAAESWLDHVPIPTAQRPVPPAELGAEAAARAYADTLAGVGAFDLVLLGLGEDGHTASLFPGHDWGTADDAPDMLAVDDAPKPPPQRISMSAARLSRARAVLFLVDGEAKRQAVKRWHAGDDIPARAIRPRGGVDVLLETSLLA